MDEQFIIKHQDGDIVRKVRCGKIWFKERDGIWTVGLEMNTFGDAFEMTDEEEWDEENYIAIHLMDYPVGEEDPRSLDHLEIRVPRGEDPDEARPFVNLYFGEHFQPNGNLIQIRKLPDGDYFVAWSCTSADVDYYDRRAKDNEIAITGRARVVDFIQYPW